MKPSFRHSITGLLLPLLVATLACSISTGPSNPNAPTGPSAAATADSGYRYDDLPSPVNEGSAISEFRAIAKWDKLDIAYFFINSTDKLQGDSELEVVRQAFDLWAQQSSLTFTEAFSEAQADLSIGWASGNHGDGDPFDGPGDILAHATFPNPYDDRQVFLHFDDDERWVNSDSNDVDLLTVAAHEIGHTLGLAHSNDPRALMYPSYGGPHRFLDEDDIQGVQAIYGAVSNSPEAPDVPSSGEQPPASTGPDADQDGISDDYEVLATGTDPNNEDSDGDGLGDGVEVDHRMNPLDADMDKDGVSDGQEVANGTDPLFPEQSDISPELENEVSDFLTEAIELQIEAYRQGEASIAASVMAGQVYDELKADIDSLNGEGLVSISEIDYYESYIHDIRVVSETNLQVDTCEVWTTSIYRLSDGQLVESGEPALLPQTVTIQQLDGGWFITSVAFQAAPAFCS